jgi:hypothetical protein
MCFVAYKVLKEMPVSEMPATRLVLEMKAGLLGEFSQLLQRGFAVTAHVGCTMDRLLGRQWQCSPEYVAERITTIFLDSRPIDNVTTAIVREGAVIALSGAMPGLVGATMRRGGFYAALREGITHHETGADSSDRIGTVRVKLFNLLIPELGPDFLCRGIILTTSELKEFITGREASFWQGCSSAMLNGSPVGPSLLQSGEPIPQMGTVRLTVNFKG